MGEFGNEEQAHAGLSGYSLDRGTEDATTDIADRMGVSGKFQCRETVAFERKAHRRVASDAVMYVAVYEGTDVGRGPDGEELFRPSRIVASWKTRDIRDAADIVSRLAALGIVD